MAIGDGRSNSEPASEWGGGVIRLLQLALAVAVVALLF